jgi:hypothetical protein
MVMTIVCAMPVKAMAGLVGEHGTRL